MDNDKIKNCPCCDGESRFFGEYHDSNDDLGWIECTKCHICTPTAGKEDVTKIWNKRNNERD